MLAPTSNPIIYHEALHISVDIITRTHALKSLSQNQAAIDLIRAWRTEGDVDEQRAAWQAVQQILDEDA